MKKLLVTGFDPFGGETINPAWEAVSRLPVLIGSYELTKLQVPTVFGKAADLAARKAEELSADAILCVGQAGGRDAVTPERVAINLRDARIADNVGQTPQDAPVVPGAPSAYFATAPVKQMAEAVRRADLPARVSYTAGTFVCNDLFYSMLHLFGTKAVPVAFVHVPFLPEQAKDGQPSLPLADIVCALTAVIEAMSEEACK